MGSGSRHDGSRILDAKQTGKMVNQTGTIIRYQLPLDVPVEVISLPVEAEDTEANTTGAKGLGEPVTIPTAAAMPMRSIMPLELRITEPYQSPHT